MNLPVPADFQHFADHQLNSELIETNGIRLRVFTAGEGPEILLIHGWPELWYSWRHQIEALSQAGYKVIVPDVRGYGGSDKPFELSAYRMSILAADMAGIIESYLANSKASSLVVIGHDWGAPIAWHTALLHPDKVHAVGGLSVPYIGRSPEPPLQLWRRIYQDRFFYQLYFEQEGIAEQELETDMLRSLRIIFYSGCADGMRELMANPVAKAKGDGMLDKMPDPAPFPDWMHADELAYYAAHFQQGGMRGPLNRYRCQDMDWHELADLKGRKIEQPSFFIAGELDPVLAFIPDQDIIAKMKQHHTTQLLFSEIIADGGHWIQQEKPAQVNKAILHFLRQLDEL
ncbi:MAG: alpha/beta fold hydrolase [Gammaproteobacteria bacterium]